MTSNVKGYTTTRPFSGFQIPIPLQSQAIRRYCEERGLTFNHHVVENISPDSFLVLERVIAEADLYKGVAMCSIGMLPASRQYRSSLLARCFASGTKVHFLFEQFVLASEADIEALNELLVLTNLAENQSSRVGDLRRALAAT